MTFSRSRLTYGWLKAPAFQQENLKPIIIIVNKVLSIRYLGLLLHKHYMQVIMINTNNNNNNNNNDNNNLHFHTIAFKAE